MFARQIGLVDIQAHNPNLQWSIAPGGLGKRIE
jgi:hypothetical protein